MRQQPRETYTPNPERYAGIMPYRRSGNRGLKLSALSLGFWWNFGEIDTFASSRERVLRAFDLGITVFDLANNYGPPFGAAEETFGRIFTNDLRSYRHEMVITSKAGHDMWNGPYGDGSSRKMLMTSIDESLQRMHLDYVDIFYTHRYDAEVPIEETAQALVDIVHSGKALYVGISKYPADKLQQMCTYLNEAHVPCLVYQSKCNMLDNTLSPEHKQILANEGIGFTAFSPLANGLLSNKYLKGIPSDSRAAQGKYISADTITDELRKKLNSLNDIAKQRGQSLSQMAISWLLNQEITTSVIIGPRTLEQLNDCAKAVNNIAFSDEQLAQIAALM